MGTLRPNPLYSIISKGEYDIPVIFLNKGRTSYFAQLKILFQRISNYLQSTESKYFEPCIRDEICKNIYGFQVGLLEVIEQYLNGFPSKAYILFEEILEYYEISKHLNSQAQIVIPKNTLFYRTQKQYDAIPEKLINKFGFLNYKKPFDLFHPLFDKRYMVSTNRFSISGYPCLYLSKELGSSYSESFQDKDDSQFHCVGFKNIRPLYFMDISGNNLFGKDKNTFEAILPKGKRGAIHDVSTFLNDLIFYQLVIASHTKINYQEGCTGKKVYFKSEYIIPQLILQWIKKNSLSIDGIKYFSCTSHQRFPKLKFHYNFVLPVKNSLNNGYCPSLSSLFYSSEVFSYFKKRKASINSRLLKIISNDLQNSTFSSLSTT